MITAPAPTTAIDPALATLLDDPRLAGAALAIAVGEQGAVLTGTVRNIWQYQALRAMTMRLPVVVDVGIIAARRDDTEIAAAVHDVLGREGADVRARVRGGLVTLTGTADAIAHAAIIARVGTLPGVVGIVDSVRA
jgi:osmotically-inducible protein OsmY